MKIRDFVLENSDRLVEEFRKILAMESVSAENRGVSDVAKELQELLDSRGIESEVVETPRHPIVLGSLTQDDAENLLLVYGHYDVQPPGDPDLWDYPAFSARIVDDRIYGRGASDSKNNVMGVIHAVETLLAVEGGLPVDLVLVLDGEEEIGSPSLPEFIRNHMDQLGSSDAALVADSHVDNEGRPELWLGLKGLLYVELKATSRNKVDLHSSLGGVVENPLWSLVELLGSMRGERVGIRGFYDDVIRDEGLQTRWITRLLESFPTKESFEEAIDVKLRKDLGYREALRRLYFEPTLNIDGMIGGYTVEGASKTVTPSESLAKVDMRLVPNQDPEKIFRKFRAHADQVGGGAVEVRKLGALPSCRVGAEEPIVRATRSAMKETYGTDPVEYPTSPASGGMAHIPTMLGVPMAFAGSGPPLAHRPNEYITREQYLKGVELFARIMKKYGAD